MRPASRATAPVVLVQPVTTAPWWRGVAADGFCDEGAGTTRAAGRATVPWPAAGLSRRAGRSACCLTASCISTFGAPIKTPGAGGARPSPRLKEAAGGACTSQMRILASSPWLSAGLGKSPGLRRPLPVCPVGWAGAPLLPETCGRAQRKAAVR